MKQQNKLLISILMIGVLCLLAMGFASATSGLNFKDIKYSPAGAKLTVTGSVISDDEPVGNLDVQFFCHDNVIGTGKTDNKGNLRMQVDRNSCTPQETTWLSVTHGNNDYRSDEFPMPDRMFGASLDHRQNPPKNNNWGSGHSGNPVGVPEFSPLALGLAIVGVTLGVAFLRKN